MRHLNVGLSAADKERRRQAIGGSDATVIARGEPDALLRLWQEKTGAATLDLSGSLPATMGSWTEELNRYWFEKQTGLTVAREGQWIRHGEFKFLSATLDGMTTIPTGEPAVFEAKHVNPFDFSERKVLADYGAQLSHNMFVAGVEHAVLSVFVGTQRWDYWIVPFDPFFHDDLLAAERRFWQSVEAGEPPVPLPVKSKPVIGKTRIDMTGSNTWATAAADYIETRPAALRNKSAGETIRALVPETAAAAFGHGVTVRRDKRGAARINLEE